MDWVVPTLRDRWGQRWPDSRPVGHELRGALGDRWVRFHSLPGSKRYADTQTEYDEILRRHFAVLVDVAHAADAELGVITASYSDSESTNPGPPDVRLPAEHWTSLVIDDEDPDSGWMHLYVSAARMRSDEVRAVLLQVADWKIADVIMFDASLSWLYHPYDGGADAILPSSDERDRLKFAHSAWLSDHPQGL